MPPEYEIRKFIRFKSEKKNITPSEYRRTQKKKRMFSKEIFDN